MEHFEHFLENLKHLITRKPQDILLHETSLSRRDNLLVEEALSTRKTVPSGTEYSRDSNSLLPIICRT